MNLKHRLLLVLVPVYFLLSACGPEQFQAEQITAEAEGYATRSAADQQAASQEQAREQLADEHQRDMQLADWGMMVRTQVTPMLVFMIQVYVALGAIVVTGMTFTTGYGYSVAVIGAGKALAKAADRDAALIKHDPRTRLLPALRYMHNGRWYVSNLENGRTMILNEAKEADYRVLAMLASIQIAGTIAYEAGHAKHERVGEMISTINPTHFSIPDADTLEMYLGALKNGQVSNVSAT